MESLERGEREMLAHRLRHLRREARLSERALARVIYCSHNSVWRYEHAMRAIPLDLAEMWVWVCEQEMGARRELRRDVMLRALRALDPT